jgi:8-oxo-dGTP diphosphatase
VEPGEAESAAVVRECREELGVSVAVEGQLGRAPIGENLELVLYAATLTKGQPTSSATHDLLRWLAMDELATVQWLEPDNKLLNAVEQHVSRRSPRHR